MFAAPLHLRYEHVEDQAAAKGGSPIHARSAAPFQHQICRRSAAQ